MTNVQKSHESYVGPVIEDAPEVTGGSDNTILPLPTEKNKIEAMTTGGSEHLETIATVNGLKFVMKDVPIDEIIVESNVRELETMELDDLVASFRLEGYDRTFPMMGHYRSDGLIGLIRGHRRNLSIQHLRDNHPVEYDRHFGKNAKVPVLVPYKNKTLNERQITILKIDHSQKKRTKPLNSWEKFEAVRQFRRVGIDSSSELAERLGMFRFGKDGTTIVFQTSQVKKYLGWLHFNGTILREVRIFHLFGSDTIVNKSNGLRVCPEDQVSLVGTDLRAVTVGAGKTEVTVLKDSEDREVSGSSEGCRIVAKCTFNNLDALGGIVRHAEYGESSDLYTKCWVGMQEGKVVKFVKGSLIMPDTESQDSPESQDAPSLEQKAAKKVLLDWGDNPVIRDAMSVVLGLKTSDALADTVSQATPMDQVMTALRTMDDAGIAAVMQACQDRLAVLNEAD